MPKENCMIHSNVLKVFRQCQTFCKYFLCSGIIDTFNCCQHLFIVLIKVQYTCNLTAQIERLNAIKKAELWLAHFFVAIASWKWKYLNVGCYWSVHCEIVLAQEEHTLQHWELLMCSKNHFHDGNSPFPSMKLHHLKAEQILA